MFTWDMKDNTDVFFHKKDSIGFDSASLNTLHTLLHILGTSLSLLMWMREAYISLHVILPMEGELLNIKYLQKQEGTLLVISVPKEEEVLGGF